MEHWNLDLKLKLNRCIGWSRPFPCRRLQIRDKSNRQEPSTITLTPSSCSGCFIKWYNNVSPRFDVLLYRIASRHSFQLDAPREWKSQNYKEDVPYNSWRASNRGIKDSTKKAACLSFSSTQCYDRSIRHVDSICMCWNTNTYTNKIWVMFSLIQ